MKFRVNWHHVYMSDELEKVITGETENLIINVSPGSSKTEMAVVNFMSRGFAINPWARFLHLSYADELALLNSQTTRDLVASEDFQKLWPMKIANDSKSKSRWNVMIDGRKAGGVYATSLGGQITGFRAGHMEEGFTGAIIIDDPLKPEDTYSPTKVMSANRRLVSTVKSRRANPKVPIILIMQRLGEEDPTAFIKSGALGGKWKHIVIPSVLDETYVASLDSKYQVLITRDAEERFSYWPYKEPISELLEMEKGNATTAEGQKVSRYVFASQYQQNPVAIGGNIIKGEKFGKYTQLPRIKYRKIYADTAQKTKERNDFSVFECWGLGDDGKIYLLDIARGKWEAPELEAKAISFWSKHNSKESYPYEKFGQLRKMMVEDKSSGTGLIQKIRRMNNIPIEEIPRDRDKLTRVMDVVGYIDSGLVCVPESAPFTHDFVTECEAFTSDDSHSYDDQVDPMIDAITDLLSGANKLEIWKKLI